MSDLKFISDKIFELGLISLRQANGNLTSFNQFNPGSNILAVLNAAHAGELFLKSIIAREHPLLIFKNLHEIVPKEDEPVDIQHLLSKGITHDFSKLPNIFWAVTGSEIPHKDSFNSIRKLRNQIQHFLEPSAAPFEEVAMGFIFKNVDPIIKEHYDLCAIDFIDEEFYDYLVRALVNSEIKFSIPENFEITEIDLALELQLATSDYQKWFEAEMVKIGNNDFRW